MSSFSLVISPPDPSQAGFIESFTPPTLPKEDKEERNYITLRSATMHYVHPKLRLMA